MQKLRQGGFIIAKIHQLTGRIFSKMFRENNVDEFNPAQGRILGVLWQKDAISINELANLTQLGNSTLTGMLDRLEASGHIVRVSHPEDRRKTLIKLTLKSESLNVSYEKVITNVSNIYYQGFSPEEIDRFEADLERIIKNLINYKKGLRQTN